VAAEFGPQGIPAGLPALPTDALVANGLEALVSGRALGTILVDRRQTSQSSRATAVTMKYGEGCIAGETVVSVA